MRCRVFVVLWGMGRGGGWIPAFAGMTWVVAGIFGKGVFQERD